MPNWLKDISAVSGAITLFLMVFGPVLVVWYTRKVSNDVRDDTIKTYSDLNDALEAKVRAQEEEIRDLREEHAAALVEVQQLKDDLEWLQQEKLLADRSLQRLQRQLEKLRQSPEGRE